jgi:hypothetical protein
MSLDRFELLFYNWIIGLCLLVKLSETALKSTSDHANFADNWHKWHKWHKNNLEIAEIAANFAIPVIFRYLIFVIHLFPSKQGHFNILGVAAAARLKRPAHEPGSPTI